VNPSIATCLLSTTGLTKSFGSLVANDSVTLEINSGEIHAVVGENGAGKTTLMRMLSGEISPDSGDIVIKGEKARLRSPQDAVRLGVGMVRQHYSVIPDFSLLDNLLLAVPGSSARPLTRAQLAKAVAYLREEGFADPEGTAVRDLSVDELQRFEIARLLFVGADILILDEPTAVLGPIEIERLYARLRELADQGRAIVVITHKLGEVESHADRVTVMRGGLTVLSGAGSLSREDLLTAMFGDHLKVANEQDELVRQRGDHVMGGVVLDVRDLGVVGHDGRARVDGITFTVRAGEILCILGVEGNGQAHLMDALAGLRSASGQVLVGSQDVTADSPRSRFHHGVRFVSEDRHRWDVLKDATVSENFLAHDYADGRALGHTSSRGKTVTELVMAAMERFDIRPRVPRMRLGNLSGGNQQRTVVARESAGSKDVLLLSHPTRGLDVIGAATIVEDVLQQRAKGVAVIWNTADIDEALSVGDSFLVMYKGQAAFLGPRSEATRDRIALAMSGSGGH
jgi:simple sugar transport system ATP-binding protein